MPRPMIRTAEDTGPGAKPSTIAFIGVVTWQHLANVPTLDWRTQHPLSIWRTNFESRDCECLWLSAYQQLSPTIVPCSLPVNITTPKSVFRGLGRVYSFVNDDTGAIVSTAAKFRSLMIANTSGFATAADRLRFYSLNLVRAHLLLFSRPTLSHSFILSGFHVSTGARADRGKWRGGKLFVCGHLFHKRRGEHTVAVVPKRRAQRQHAWLWW